MWVHRGDHRSAWGGTEVSSTRKSALVAGVFFIVAAAAAIVGLLSVVTLRQAFAGEPGAGGASLVVAGRALVAMHDWTFLFGPNLALGVNTSLLAYLMFRSGLVPRVIAVLGLVGGPLIFASGTAVLFGLYGQTSAWGAVTALPVFAWEMSLAVWMIVKGFNPAPWAQDETSPSSRTVRSSSGV